MNVVPSFDSPRGRFAMLAPPQATVPDGFHRVDSDRDWHGRLLHRMQKVRGSVYLEEGAIQRSQLSPDGAHHMQVDGRAWHVLALDDIMRIYGCARYMEHPNTVQFSRLGVSSSPLAQSSEWGGKFRDAVESDIELARRRGIAYVEVGGWALLPDVRRSIEALRIALATYGLARSLGGCIGIATATRRHCSSTILRRIGGRPLRSGGVDLPAYYDPHYGCEMEIVRFDSSEPNPRYEGWIDELTGYLQTEPVIHSQFRPPIPINRPMVVPEPMRFAPVLAAAV